MEDKANKAFLVINPFGIGDVLFSTPLVRELKETFPAARIYYLCNAKTAPVIASNPCVNGVFVYERDEFVSEGKKSFLKGLKKYWDFISSIRAKKIDTCLDLSLNTPYGFFAWAAGIRLRCGLNFKNRGVFLNRKLDMPGFVSKHVADYYMDVLGLIGIEPRQRRMEVYPTARASAWADEFAVSGALSGKNLVVGIAPCGGAAFGKDAGIKRWPRGHFTELSNRLIGEFGAVILMFAGPSEQKDVADIISGIKHKSRVLDLSRLSLEETIAMTAKCGLFIANDTGPLRFADAMGKKIIALFGPVDEKIYGPYPFEEGRTVVLKKDMPCRPCYRNFRLAECANSKKCLSGITVDEVLNAVKTLL